MPRYFLNVVETNDPNPPNDHEPQEFPNIEAACEEATLAIREMAAEALYAGTRLYVERIDITDEGGEVVARVSFDEAMDGAAWTPKSIRRGGRSSSAS